MHSYCFWAYCKFGDVFIVNSLLSGTIYNDYHRDLRRILPTSKKRKHILTNLFKQVTFPGSFSTYADQEVVKVNDKSPHFLIHWRHGNIKSSLPWLSIISSFIQFYLIESRKLSCRRAKPKKDVYCASEWNDLQPSFARGVFVCNFSCVLRYLPYFIIF